MDIDQDTLDIALMIKDMIAKKSAASLTGETSAAYERGFKEGHDKAKSEAPPAPPARQAILWSTADMLEAQRLRLEFFDQAVAAARGLAVGQRVSIRLPKGKYNSASMRAGACDALAARLGKAVIRTKSGVNEDLTEYMILTRLRPDWVATDPAAPTAPAQADQAAPASSAD